MQHIRTTHMCSKHHRNLKNTVFSIGLYLSPVLLPFLLERELIGPNTEPVPMCITDRKMVFPQSKA